MTVNELIMYGSLTIDAAMFLKSWSKRNTIFSSVEEQEAETSFLNALSSLIPQDERIVTIEDSAELQLSTIKILPD